MSFKDSNAPNLLRIVKFCEWKGRLFVRSMEGFYPGDRYVKSILCERSILFDRQRGRKQCIHPLPILDVESFAGVIMATAKDSVMNLWAMLKQQWQR